MLKLSLFFLFFVLLPLSGRAKDKELCPHVILRDGKFRLNKNEKIIICGDENAEAWQQVPLEQAQAELKVLFQKAGFYNPKFQREGENLIVEMGPRTEIEKWNLVGSQEVVDKRHKRKVIGEALTPEKLDEVEKWVDSELKARGFACPTVKSKAHVWNNTVDTNYETGQQLSISSLQREGMQNLDEEAFKRFEAFEVNDRYDNRKLQITSNRVLTDGLAQSSYYTQKCTDAGVELTHHLEIGEPRILRVGFGASSEELPFLDAWYKNTRIDARASSYWLLLHASPRTQSFSGSSELYILPFSKRTFIGPRFEFARKVENSYITNGGKTGLDIGRLWDWQEKRFNVRVGPTLNYLNTIQGFGPDDVSFITVNGSLAVMNNDYELTGGQQFEGYTGTLSYQGQRKGLGSPLSADRWSVRGKNLWNVRQLSPPLFIFATRFETSVTTSDQLAMSNSRDILPQEYRNFLGGEENLRGFSRQSIDNKGLGYLTAAYFGSELRLVEEVPWNLEPLVLWDVAKVGQTPWHLDGPIFQSLGAGLRWRSPLGPIRVTAARGFIWHGDQSTEATPQQWAFQFSFGREF